VVQPGDTLYSIARRFGTTVESLASANDMDDPAVLEVGRELRITAASEGAPAIQPPASPAPSAAPQAASLVDVIDTGHAVVSLTFDAGSDTGFAAQILDTLNAYGIKATFGITGKWAAANHELTRRIVEDGHGLINHTYDHPSFTGFSTGGTPLSEQDRRYQLERTEQVILELTGTGAKPYFRPPYGDYDEALHLQLGAWGYRYNVMWTVDSLGWKGLTAEEIVARCLESAQPGAIYLFHVGSASQDAAALPAVIEGLRGRDYSFATIAELLEAHDS
jgi:peptidoglycan/xylan/chitin deacetylase (PgdA/CDA1 family)